MGKYIVQIVVGNIGYWVEVILFKPQGIYDYTEGLLDLKSATGWRLQIVMDCGRGLDSVLLPP